MMWPSEICKQSKATQHPVALLELILFGAGPEFVATPRHHRQNVDRSSVLHKNCLMCGINVSHISEANKKAC